MEMTTTTTTTIPATPASTATNPANVGSPAAKIDGAALTATNPSSAMETTSASPEVSSELILNLQRTIHEQQSKIAAFEAHRANEHSRDKERIEKHMEDANQFFNRLSATASEHEREAFLEECAKAKTFLNSVPKMEPLDMARHAPLVAVTCKASKAFAHIDELNETVKEKDAQLKRALERTEELEQENSKMRKEHGMSVQLAEARQASLEQVIKENEEIKSRVQKHDFAMPIANREYTQALEEMRKYTESVKSGGVKTEASPTPVADSAVKTNGKAPMQTGTSAEERAAIMGAAGGGAGLTTTTMCASAGSASGAGTSSEFKASQSSHVSEHVNYLSNLIMSRSTPSTNIHASASRGAPASDVVMSDADRVMAALR